jgi:hypothetical protein
MSREEIRNLIGGYATGNLTKAERAALFAAALEDQELFDELAREQPLAELLEDPAARGRLLAALGEPEAPWGARLWGWMRRPAVAALAASAAVAVVALVLFVPRGERHEEVKPVQVAEARKEAAPPAPAAPAPEFAQQPKPRAKPKAAAKVKREDAPMAPPPAVALPPPERAAPLREEAQVMAQAPAEAVADAAGPAAFRRSRGPTVARSSLRVESGVLGATVVRLTPDGGYAPVAASVAVGDAVRLRVETAAAGYLSVLEREGQTGWRQVFGAQVEAGRTYFVPAEGSLGLQRGTKEYLVMLSGAGGQPAPVRERVVLEVK